MTTEWAHLPNAVHIDRVVASAKAYSDLWSSTSLEMKRFKVAWGVVRDAAFDSTWDLARVAVWRDAHRKRAGTDEIDNKQQGVWYSILGLIMYDDCAYMLDSDPGELAILAAFGNPGAILLLPACKAFHSIKEIV